MPTADDPTPGGDVAPVESTRACRVMPLGPRGPSGPVCPRSDCRAAGEMSERWTPCFLMLRVETAPVFSSDAPTEPARNCLDPTLLRGNVNAYDVPPRAMNTAKVDITFP